MNNEYIPFLSEIKEVIKHTEKEYTFRMEFTGDVKPGQFFEVSLPKFGEAPISVSGIGEGYVDLTIRKVGKVTNEVFEKYVGERLFLRGPYGNGFDISNYSGKEVIIVAGGTGVSPVKALIDHFANNPEDAVRSTLIAGFRSPTDMLFRREMEIWNKNLSTCIITVDGADEDYKGDVGLVTKYVADLEIKNKDNVQVIVVGPPMMMKFTVMEFEKLGIKEKNIWISQERKMCCGIGKCGHCRMGDTYICLDGPVFNYTEGKLLID